MKTKYFILISILFVSSCKDPGKLSDVLAGQAKESGDLQELTNNYTTIPSTHDITEHINDTVEAPKADCVPKVGAPPAAKPQPSRQSVNSCKYFKKFADAGVPKNALKQALTFYDNNKDRFDKKGIISIADYSMRSNKKRFFLLNLKTGEIQHNKVSHGSGKADGVRYGDATLNGDTVVKKSNHDGHMRRCRIPKSKVPKGKHDQWALTRAGFFKTRDYYFSVSHDESVKGTRGWPTFTSNGRKYNGMRMQGLVKGVNDKALDQGVVMHEAYYNTGAIMGRSFGCPAFVPKEGRKIMEKIRKGSLYYSYTPIPGCKSDHDKVLKTVPGWENKCN
jgi:hypothetical protein